MSTVLLMRLVAPLQSWGTRSRFSHRDTGREPSKSGVLGLLGAALGVPRDDEATVARLAALAMGVRVEREGQVLVDYHTAGGGRVPGRPYGVANARGGLAGTVLSERDCLADADFLVGLAGDDEALLQQADRALADPVWPLFLGRRCFPPAQPPRLGLHPGELAKLLAAWPWRKRRAADVLPPGGLRLVLEADDPGAQADDAGEVRYDCPVSFSSSDRRYRVRRVTTRYVTPTTVTGGRAH
jgi:CRISPR system Cascade subunit CasD